MRERQENKEILREVEVQAYTQTHFRKRDTQKSDGVRGPQSDRDMQRCADRDRDMKTESETRRVTERKKIHRHAQAQGENCPRQKRSLKRQTD